MRSRGTLLFVAAALIAGGTIADARILGGGPKSTDCFLYFNDITATKGQRVDCTDNDPTCDFDAGTAGQCTFRFTVCSDASDAPGCTPSDVTKFSGSGAKKVTLPPIGPAACAASPTDITVKLKKSKSTNVQKLKFTTITAATGNRKRDLDTLILKCVASPSGAFIFE